ncbi:MAG: cobalt-precorrin-5B (C(1))-methyltransferase CbiD [Spirochaetaceae bacterium]|jgi:cobalt-precorrin-5B (C1)-methyltransferase|nr:cobalt-precorrin-5B (C(1))-methyltransferase CbiD [Spirochaetaceae bacterium]
MAGETGYRLVGGKRMRCGYTTGSCAAAAARAAAAILLESGGEPEEARAVEISTPSGRRLRLRPEDIRREAGAVSCAVRKDAGDDPDVTDGILVYARVEKIDGTEIVIEGGPGVGRVTKAGLDAAPGEAAINKTPLAMIRENLEAICRRYGRKEGLKATISVPGGEELARRTFNPDLGIVGGLSILGTSGIVEPMSDDGFIGAIEAELRILRAEGERKALITPGNYGRDFLAARGGELNSNPVKCANYIGDALDIAADMGFQYLLLVGHIGKLVKLAVGNFNTHSKYGDPRMEVFAAHTALAGGDRELIARIMDCATTESAIGLLLGANLWDNVKKSVFDAIQKTLDRRSGERITSGAVIFSSQWGLLGSTARGEDLLSRWKTL